MPTSLVERAPPTLVARAAISGGQCPPYLLMINAAACPVLFAPAMNNRMWENPITKENVAKLQKHGYRFVGPEEGWLACRNVGAGRMSEVAGIVAEATQMLARSIAIDRPTVK